MIYILMCAEPWCKRDLVPLEFQDPEQAVI